jgi:hypothetical protein
MIKVFSLILYPTLAWKRILQERRGVGSIFVGYLLPVMLMVSIVEALGMTAWREWFVGIHGVIHFTLGQALVFETMHFALTLLLIVSCASIFRILGDPFYSRFSYRQALTVVMYSLSPWLLFQPLSAVPWINLWIPWAIGIFFSLKVLYHGMPRMLDSAPGHALGLYLVSSIFIVMLTGAEWYMIIQSLTGKGVLANEVICSIAAKLPF